MKKTAIILSLAALVVLGGYYIKLKYYDPKHKLDRARREVERFLGKEEVRDGDLIFQTSLSRQSEAIQKATKSRYSHCGLIFRKGGGFVVYEAVQPVKTTPLDR